MPARISPPPNYHSQRFQNKSFSLLKRNELLIIFIAALLVTVVIFFVFFRSPDLLTSSQDTKGDNTSQLEEKITSLESKIQALSITHPVTSAPASNEKIIELQQKTARMESGFILKVDALLHKMELLETRVKQLEQQMKTISAATSLPPVPPKAPKAEGKNRTTPNPTVSSEKVSQKSPPTSAKKPVSKKRAVQKNKKNKPLFHTVKKGETLWSISQQHKTTVKKLRELNHLTKESKIYPGINILIR